MLRAIGRFLKFIVTLIFIVILLAGLAIGYARFIEPNLLTTSELAYTSSSIKKEVTIAIFADTHFGFQYDLDDFQKVIDKVNEAPPDIVLFGGDLIDNLTQYKGSTAAVSQKLSQLKANVGKYAVFGNHDYGGGAQYQYEDIMKAGGFKVLVNDSVDFYEYNLRLIGIDDLLIGFGNPQIAQNANSDMYNLVLCHEPDIVSELTHSNVNFMVAAHTHGGQIRVPFYMNQFLPAYGEKYVKGEYKVGRAILYVNSGVGTTKIPARFLAPPELTYITLSPQQ